MSDERYKLKCGHWMVSKEFNSWDGIAYVQFTCEIGCKSEWGFVGEIPYPVDLEMEGEDEND